MIDEQLIDEVEQHGVIYNRQKYCINMGAGGGAGIGSGCSSSGVNKYETKDEAWQEIAVNLRSDVETCKKRWKYLRERYVSQRKQGDPPVYEHLSRPYLEKMKFLDQHIQPRKSYRNVSSFLTSPNASNSFCEYNMDSSKSNSSMKNNNHSFNSQQHSQHQQLQQQQSQSSIPYPQENIIKTEEDPTFRDFVAAVASQSQHLQQQINSHHAASFNPNMMVSPGNGSQHGNSNVLSPAIQQQQQQSVDSYDQYRSNEPNANAGLPNNVGNGVPSSTSSSMKSPLSSSPPPPPSAVVANNNASSELSDEHNFATNSSGNSMKKARVQMSSKYLDTSDSDDSPASTMRHAKMLSDTKHAAAQHLHQAHQHQQQQQQQQILQQQQKHQQQFNKMFNNTPRNMNSINHTSSAAQAGLFPSSNDFLFSLYQQMSPAAAAAAAQQQERNINAAAASAASPSTARSSEHLLGELVTSELLKMNKDRRKTVQKRILEILFFED